MKTPQATVGVRGTVIEGFVDVRGYEIFALLEGALDVCTSLGCRSLNTPGTFVVVSPGGVIGEPLAIPPQMMASLLLPTPSLNLVLEYFFTVVASGQDPLPRFRGLNEAQNGNFPNSRGGRRDVPSQRSVGRVGRRLQLRLRQHGLQIQVRL